MKYYLALLIILSTVGFCADAPETPTTVKSCATKRMIAPPPSLEELRKELRTYEDRNKAPYKYRDFAVENFMQSLLYVALNAYCLEHEKYQAANPSLSGLELFFDYFDQFPSQSDLNLYNCLANYSRDVEGTCDQDLETWVNAPKFQTYMGFPNSHLSVLFRLFDKESRLTCFVLDDIKALQKYVADQEYQILETQFMSGDIRAAETLFTWRTAYDIVNQKILGVQACLSETFADFVKVHLFKDMPVDSLRKWAQKYNHPAILSKVREIMRNAADEEFDETMKKYDASYPGYLLSSSSKGVLSHNLENFRFRTIGTAGENLKNCGLRAYGLPLGHPKTFEKEQLIRYTKQYQHDLDSGEESNGKDYEPHIKKIEEYCLKRQAKNTLIERYKALLKQESAQTPLSEKELEETRQRIKKRNEKTKAIAITKKVIEMTKDYVERYAVLRQTLENQPEGGKE